MIIVTGTKRSGTSMWMQALIAAGFPHVGSAFPLRWGESIRDANPLGFFESKLRLGIYFATNPDPETGAYIQPSLVERHVVKVFIPGLVRTDIAYIGRVVATMRNWREYVASRRRMDGMQQVDGPAQAPHVPYALEWWFENYDLIRNAATRRYPLHMTTYDRLLRDPDRELDLVLRWLESGDRAAAVAAIHPEVRTQREDPAAGDAGEVDELVADAVGLFDELFEAVDRVRALDARLIEELSRTHQRLEARWTERRPAIGRDVLVR